MFKTLGQYLPPPAGSRSPALWGTRERLAELFDGGASSITAEPRHFMFRYRSPSHFLDVFATYYGPVLKALAALDSDRRASLLADLQALIGHLNRADDGTMVVPGEQFAVVKGDPTKEGLYVVRLKVPAGYRIEAHTHPNDENVTVLSGSFNIGTGDKLDQSKGTRVKAGGYL